MAGFPAELPASFGGDLEEPSGLFTRVIRALLPDALAWRLGKSKTLRKLVEGLSAHPAMARGELDRVHGDLIPESTRELERWESQFGIVAASSDDDRVAALEAAWQATGGQSPRYLQDVMRAAGFEVAIHEWWSSGPPYVARDPRTYTAQPLVGSVQCGDTGAECGEPDAECNEFLANDPGYLVNLSLNQNAPPAVPSDSTKWPFFLYWGGGSFPGLALVDEGRRAEFERLLLRINPSHLWLVTLVEYVDFASPPALPYHTLLLAAYGTTLGASLASLPNLGSSGVPFDQATGGNQPTVELGPHGKPEIVFDGVDDFLESASDLTIPTNHIVVTVFRAWKPAEIVGAFGQVWLQGDPGTISRATLLANGNIFAVSGSSSGIQGTPPGQPTDPMVLALAAPSFPTGTLIADGETLDSKSDGTDTSPITGPHTLGATGSGAQASAIAVMMHAIIYADALQETQAEALARIQEWAEAEFFDYAPRLPFHTLLLPGAGVTVDADGGAETVKNWGYAGGEYGHATPSRRVTIGVGPHGRPEFVWDGADDILESLASTTLPANFAVLIAMRASALPSEQGHFSHVWTMSDSPDPATRLTVVNGDDTPRLYVGGTQVAAGSALVEGDMRAYLARVTNGDEGELRLNNAVEDSGTGTDTSPVVGIMQIGNNSAGTNGMEMAVSLFAIVDLDLINGTEETVLAAAQAWMGGKYLIQ